MNYGLYLSAAGTLSSMFRQDVIANNLANLNTVGFKPDMVYNRQRLPERLESAAPVHPNLLLERLGGGQFIDPTYVNLKQGSLQQTGNDLDVAIEGDGFFAVRSAAGPGEPVRFTRDGRFSLNDQGELVMVASGLHVLDTNNQSIRLRRDLPVEIQANGDIIQNGETRGRIQVTLPRDTRTLQKLGDNLLQSADPAARAASDGRLVQRHLESSAVDAIMTLNDLIGAAKAVAANIKMMQYHDHIMGQAVNTLGRVA